MSYNPTEWKNGDIITADKLNKLENGIADSGSSSSGIISYSIVPSAIEGLENMTLTVAEILDAFNSGKMCIRHSAISEEYEDSGGITYISENYSICWIEVVSREFNTETQKYTDYYVNESNGNTYYADDIESYPSRDTR